jgi:hypothetical protein
MRVNIVKNKTKQNPAAKPLQQSALFSLCVFERLQMLHCSAREEQ